MAARSLGLAAYRALVRRGGAEDAPPYIPRPEGELVWMHAAEAGNVLAVIDLAKRFMAMRGRSPSRKARRPKSCPRPRRAICSSSPPPANTPTMWRASLTIGGLISACGHGAG